MERIRSIRTYRRICEEALKIKEQATGNEKLIEAQFKKRQTEVDAITNLALLSVMKKYTIEIQNIKNTSSL